MAVAVKDGVVMGADTRTSAGSLVVNRASRKISKVHDRIFVCRSGSAADTQSITGLVKLYLSEHAGELCELPQVLSAASLFRIFCYNYKHMLSAGMIVAGWDEREGAQVYSIPLGGTLLRQPFSIGGSGSTYIQGLVDAHYREDMTIAEATDFVRNCVAHAMARDGASGGMIRMTVITEEKVEELVVPGDQLPYGP
eukprot:GHVO01046124.1.p1 GENE.GHVO01046124.1~~GHVO01046124.1.p1  ORF type:complete len:205 (+),score=36.29 GHVO01046124.1:29-616(+)